MQDIKQLAAVTIFGLAAGVVGALLYASAAAAAGGQVRAGDDAITWGYEKCEQLGVDSFTTCDGDVCVVVICDANPGPSFPGTDDE